MAFTSSRPLRAVAGASLLSAAATLPLHLLPILVLALGTSGVLAPAYAGWVGTAYMVGQLATVLLLPACGAKRVPWSAALLAGIAVLLATWLSIAAVSARVLAAWLVVGVMAGVLQYLGSTTAAAATNRRAAFALRMATSSITAAGLMAWLRISHAQIAEYRSVCMQFAIVFAALAAAGLLLYRSNAAVDRPSAVADSHATPGSIPSSPEIRSGLAVLFMLFVGQQGLWALLMQGASARAFALEQVVWMICASKLLGAAAVLPGIFRNAHAPSALELFISGVIVAVGGLCMGAAVSTTVYILGLMLWEVALNVLSARYQALLAYRNPVAAGMWITAGIFLGAASGHALAPYAAASGYLGAFLCLAVVTGLAPSTWAMFSSRASTPTAEHAAKV